MTQTKNKYQVMPPLSEEEYQALKEDIAYNGIQVPVVEDTDGNIIDGHHRVRACWGVRSLDVSRGRVRLQPGTVPLRVTLRPGAGGAPGHLNTRCVHTHPYSSVGASTSATGTGWPWGCCTVTGCISVRATGTWTCSLTVRRVRTVSGCITVAVPSTVAGR